MNADVEDEAPKRLLGTWIRGKYRLDRVLGVGGMAVVFAATHRNKKRVAVKMLRTSVGASADMQRRFLREGHVANTVEHPGAVSVLDDDVAEDGTAFLVMELLDGAPIDVLADLHGGTLDVSTTLTITSQLLDTLAAAHEKDVVHRDIKPGNLFATRSGHLKVLDFGIARLRDASASDAVTKAGTAFGTPAYMGPEQALGKVSEVDPRTDIWAVGATMFTLLTGREVHVAETVQHAMVLAATEKAPPFASIDPNAPPQVAAIIDRALAFSKGDRWPTAREMRDAVLAAQRELFGDASGTEALVALLPPPAPEPEVSAASVLPPPPSTPNIGDASDPFAATLVNAEDPGRSLSFVTPRRRPESLPPPRRRPPVLAIGAVVVAVAAVAGIAGFGRAPATVTVGTAQPSTATSSRDPAPHAVPSPPALPPVDPSPATAPPPPPLPRPRPSPPAVHASARAPARAPSTTTSAAPRPVSSGPSDFDTQ
jgi:serine/threonine-protein kinase